MKTCEVRIGKETRVAAHDPKLPFDAVTIRAVKRFAKDIAEELNIKELWLRTPQGLECVYWGAGKPKPTDFWEGQK